MQSLCGWPIAADIRAAVIAPPYPDPMTTN
jgi:hypothetical protein